MEFSIFLARLFGIYLLVMAADFLFRRHEIEKAVKDFASSRGLLMFSGSNSLFVGLIVILTHPIYEPSWRGIITLLGYLLIVRGIIRVAFPSYIQKKLVSFFRRGYWVVFAILFVLGLYLTYSGFVELPIQ